MANLTVNVIPKATRPTQIDDSAISDRGAAGVWFLGSDGQAAQPDSQTYGLAVTYNKAGFGEVDFWNVTNTTGSDGQGFSFYQKTGATTFNKIASVYADNSTYTEFDLFMPDGSIGISIGAAPGHASIGTELDYLNLPRVIRLQSVAFAALPASPLLGMTAVISDSSTAVWGAVIAGGGVNKVVGWYNGAAWTVFAK